jgi:hypothetical protein
LNHVLAAMGIPDSAFSGNALIERLRTLRIEHEQESGCRVIVPGRASSLARLEHCVTFCAKAELVATSGNIVG